LEGILYVDSSTSSETRLVVEGFRADFGSKLAYVASKIGAPRQKNVGLDHLKRSNFHPDVVCFLDDDIIPGSSYFEVVRQTFRDHPEAQCVGGFDQGLSEARTSGFFRFLGLTGSGQKNEILPTGLCTLSRPKTEFEAAEWVPGGMQSFRWSVVEDQRFDGRFRIHGDEVEFQTRALGNKGIYSSDRLGVLHLGAKSGKSTIARETMFMDGFRWRLAKIHPRVTRQRVVLGTIFLLFGEALRSILPSERVRLRRSLGHLQFLSRLTLRLSTDDHV
jgi:GT2 family glycosyltransferase